MLVGKAKANRSCAKRLNMTKSDVKAMSKIINGVLYGTYWFNPMVETVGRYLESKGIVKNKVDFKNMCINGSKSEENDDTLVIYRSTDKRPEKAVYIDKDGITHSSYSIYKALKDLKASQGRMLKIVTQTYGYKRKNKNNKR